MFALVSNLNLSFSVFNILSVLCIVGILAVLWYRKVHFCSCLFWFPSASCAWMSIFFPKFGRYRLLDLFLNHVPEALNIVLISFVFISVVFFKLLFNSRYSFCWPGPDILCFFHLGFFFIFPAFHLADFYVFIYSRQSLSWNLQSFESFRISLCWLSFWSELNISSKSWIHYFILLWILFEAMNHF